LWTLTVASDIRPHQYLGSGARMVPFCAKATHDCGSHNGYLRALVDAGTEVVIAVEFREMCLPRNPMTTTASRSATATAATTVVATRLARPILTLLTISSIAVSLSMMNRNNASIVPMQRTEAPHCKRR